MQEQREKARNKGFGAKTLVRNIEEIKAGVYDYESALNAGETAEAYQQRTAHGESMICGWQQTIKQKHNQ